MKATAIRSDNVYSKIMIHYTFCGSKKPLHNYEILNVAEDFWND